VKSPASLKPGFVKLLALICSGGRTAVIYGADVIRSADSKNAVAGTVDLALLTGAVAETGAGIYPLDEKTIPKVCWIWGSAPITCPVTITYGHASAAFGSAWNATVPAIAGKDLFQILDSIEAGQIKALYVIGE